METPFNDIEKKLEKIKPTKLSDSEKGILWSKIMRDIETKSYEKKLSIFSVVSRKLVLVSLLIVALVGSSATTVAASDSAKPGDILFPIDLAIEKIQLVFSKGNKKSTLRIRFAEERFSEATLALAENNSDEDVDVLETATDAKLAAQSFDSRRVMRYENALAVALSHLDNTRALLVEEGDEIGVLIIDDIIADLTDLANNYLAQLDKFEAKIKNDGNKLGIEIAASRGNLETKFKFSLENRGGGSAPGQLKKLSISFESNDNGDDGDNGDDDEGSGYGYGGNKVVLCHKGKTIVVGFPAVRAHVFNHGDSLGACAGDNGETTPDEDEIAPVLSSIVSEVTGDTTATITWTTNEDADSKVEYATSTPLDDAFDSQTKSDGDEVLSHSIELTGLLPETTYFYEVSSKDPSGNKIKSSVHSFTTAAEGDTTAPTISNIASSTTQTSVAITWNTNETSDSTIHFDINSGVDTSDTSVHSVNDVTSHSLIITGLTTSTTYYFIVTSEDPSGNATTSEEHSFTTLPAAQDTTAPAISNENSTINSHTTATITWTTDEDADSIVYYSSTTDPVITNDNATNLVSNTSLTQSHSISLSSLLEGTTYFYTVVSSDASGNTSTSTGHSFITTSPDTTAPVIDDVASTDTTVSTTIITWTTDENSDSVVWYNAGTLDLTDNTTPFVSDSASTQSHAVGLTSLTADTLYKYVVVSKDSAGNTATSSEESFTTDVAPDETAPIISSIASSTTATSATITWTTDELSDSRVRYGTSTPLDSAFNPQTETDLAEETSHNVTLSNLLSGTLYYYEVSSTDTSGNIATSTTEFSFTTQ